MDDDEVYSGWADPGQIDIRLQDTPDGQPSVMMVFTDMGALVLMPFPDQVDQIADALHEAAEGLRIEIRRRSAGAN